MTDIVMGNVAPLLKEIEELKKRVKELEKEVRLRDFNPYRKDLKHFYGDDW